MTKTTYRRCGVQCQSVALRAAALALSLSVGFGQARAQEAPLVIEEQGSYEFSGTVITSALDSTIHCDNGYVQYQIPPKVHSVPIIMWHHSGTKTWESTPGGHQGFQDIFLRRSFAVYIIDPPRQGRAGTACPSTTYTPDVGQDQLHFEEYILGSWTLPGAPHFFPNSQFPQHDTAFLNQILRLGYPLNEGPANTDSLQSVAVSALVNKIGSAVLFTHSGAGRRGWETAILNPKVKGIVAFEPGGYLYPPDMPPSPGGESTQLTVPLSDFQKLTHVPILIIFGDNIDANVPTIQAIWPSAYTHAQEFVKAVNHYGGHAELIHLPDIGIFGNGHFMMLEKNNVQIANVVSQFLHENGLDR